MLCLVASNSLQPHGLWPTRLLCPWGFSRQEYWSGLPCPPPWHLPNPGIKPRSPALWADSLLSEPPRKLLINNSNFPSGTVVKNPTANAADARKVDSISGLGRFPAVRNGNPTPVFLLGESQGRGSLVGCRLWGHTESDTTEAT